MELTDILPLEKWKDIEQKISDKFGLDVNVFNIEGYRITDFKHWANALCPAIKDTDKGQSFICAVAHMNLAAMAGNAKRPVIEECDAGLAKIVVPVMVDDRFIGAVGACGVLLDDGEADDFLINKITEIQEERIQELAQSITSISTERAEEVAAYIQTILDDILSRRKV